MTVKKVTRPTHCKRCGVEGRPGALISFRSLCSDCSTAAVVASVVDQKAKRGEYHDRWLRGISAGVARAIARQSSDNTGSGSSHKDD